MEPKIDANIAYILSEEPPRADPAVTVPTSDTAGGVGAASGVSETVPEPQVHDNSVPDPPLSGYVPVVDWRRFTQFREKAKGAELAKGGYQPKGRGKFGRQVYNTWTLAKCPLGTNCPVGGQLFHNKMGESEYRNSGWTCACGHPWSNEDIDIGRSLALGIVADATMLNTC